MKKNIQTYTLALISMLFSIQHANAQTHKSYIASANESLPMNRAAFIFCYNNGTSYKNPATGVLSKKSNAVSSTTSRPNMQHISSETVRMFPNITEDELWVQLNTETIQQPDLNIEIYNDSGVRVYNSRIEQNLHKINVCDFTTGTFLVKMGDVVQKLVIE